MNGHRIPVSKTLTRVFLLSLLLYSVTGNGSTFAQDYRYNNNSSNPFSNDPFGTQNPYNDPNDPYYDPFADEDGMSIGGDSTKVKIRKPLESYFFDDSIRAQNNFVWHIDTYVNRVHMSKIDTTLNGYQRNYPFLNDDVGLAWQGKMGGAAYPINYFDRKNYYNFDFGKAFDTYYFFPENVDFFNVKKPYSNFAYYTAGQNRRREEGFAITHAQNISPSSGFNADYKSMGTRGYYNWGKGRSKNLSLAFNHTGKKYTVHAGYVYNTINNKENGGLVEDYDLNDQTYEFPENYPVRLTDARNVIKNNAYYLIQSYGIPLRGLTEDDFSISDQSSIFVGHALIYSRWNKVYTDSRAATIYTEQVPTGGEPGEDGTIPTIPVSRQYYDNWYINPTATYDSIFESVLTNRIFVQIQPWDRDGIVGLIDAGVGTDYHHYYYMVPNDFMTGSFKGANSTDYYMYGGVQGKFRRYFDWGGDAVFYPGGDRSGDLKVTAHAAISAFIKGKPLTLSGKFTQDLRSPSFWTENYFSNHFVWSPQSEKYRTGFSKEKETRIEAKLEIPDFGIEVGGYQSVVKDKIYYNNSALPQQYSGTVSVTGAYARKDFRAGGFHFKHRVLLQWSTQEHVIPVPLASAFLSYYFEFNVVKNVLRAQLGIDGRYHTKYYAQGYMPATAQFYNQTEKKIGNYPVLDVYLVGKWKRMRLLLKMEHVNEGLFGQRDYFTVLHHPLQQRTFKFGFSWAFYD